MLDSYLYSDLLAVFQQAQGMSASKLCTAVRGCNIPEQLKRCICAAVQGDNRPLNAWLFTEGFHTGQPIAWIAPIRSDTPRYVWMVGRQNEVSMLVHQWFRAAQLSFETDPWLAQRRTTPDLLFVDTFEVSKVLVGEMRYEDEFAVFQVGYKDAPVEVPDLDQKMVINTAYAVKKRHEALARMASLGWLDDESLSLLGSDLEIFSIVHNEGHNRGHFVGAWPFEERVKKRCMLYEAVEEFRACLASVVLAEHLPLAEGQKDVYAVSVFMSRFFGFGFDAYRLEVQRRETAREITVGLMFFEWLRKKGVIKSSRSGGQTLDAREVRGALLDAYRLLFKQEECLPRDNIDGLKTVARDWYQLAFPGGVYSQEAEIVYNEIGKRL